MSSPIAAARTYYEVFQPGRTISESNPDRLAAIALVFGMQPQRVDRCRVLELGSDLGRNLFPMAERYPESTFVGIEQAGPRITAARQAAEALGLANVSFKDWQAADHEEELGSFDYILCHDLYSRVPPEQAAVLLAICRAHLKPQGVAYLGYRTPPGWIMPSVVHALIEGLSGDDDSDDQRMLDAGPILQFTWESLLGSQLPHARWLQSEVDMVRRLPPVSLAYEYVGPASHSVYFHEFAEQAAGHDLEYLGDVDLGTMFARAFGPVVERGIAQISTDAISTEQHLDLLRSRAFHRSLLCHKGVTLDRELSPKSLAGVYLAAYMRPEGAVDDVHSDAPARFVSTKGLTILTSLPSVKIALAELTKAWPRGVTLDELKLAVQARLGEGAGRTTAVDAAPADADDSPDPLTEFLIGCVESGLVDIHSEAGAFVTEVSPRPRAGAWARAEALLAGPVTNARHQPIVLDDMSRNLLAHLDGQRDRAALLKILEEAVSRGELSIIKGDMPASQSDVASQILEQVLDQSLARLAGAALLLG